MSAGIDGSPTALRVLLAQRVVPALDRGRPEAIHLADAGTPPPRSAAGLEQHQFVEMCFCLAGLAEIRVGGDVLQLDEDSILVLPAGVPHSVGTLHCITGDRAKCFSRLVWIDVFPYGAILNLCESRHGEHHSAPRHFFLERNANGCVQSLMAELEQREAGYDLMARCHLVQALTWISRGRELALESAPLDAPADEGGAQAGGDSIGARARQFILQNFHADLDLEAVARAVCTNKSHLCGEFKRETGLTVIEYLTRVRVDAARRLLATSLRAAEVSRLVGFDDPYYFSRVFKKLAGKSPSEFRAQLSSGASAP
jgi:AraC-like DNA-binding protein